MKNILALVMTCLSLMLFNGCATHGRGRVSALTVRADSPLQSLPRSLSDESTPQAEIDGATRMLVTRASLTLEVEDVEASLQAIVSEVAAIGGFVQNQNLVEDKRATLTLRIPSDKLSGLISQG